MRRFVDALASRLVRRVSRGLPLILDRRTIFILPTAQGLVMSLVIWALLLGSINYGRSLGYLITFFVASVVIVSAVWTFNELRGVGVLKARIPEGFVRETTAVEVVISPGGRLRHGLKLEIGEIGAAAWSERLSATRSLEIRFRPVKRGRLSVKYLRVSSRYPLSLFRAWSMVPLDLETIIYPAPARGRVPIPLAEYGGESPMSGARASSIAMEIHGVREYQPGDPFHRIAWKASAKGQGLFTKAAWSAREPEAMVTWAGAGGGETEERLRVMCAQVIGLAGAGARYGLELPGTRIEPASGKEHMRRCLRALALFDQE